MYFCLFLYRRPLPFGSNHIRTRTAGIHAFTPHQVTVQVDKNVTKQSCQKAPNPSDHFRLISTNIKPRLDSCIRQTEAWSLVLRVQQTKDLQQNPKSMQPLATHQQNTKPRLDVSIRDCTSLAT